MAHFIITWQITNKLHPTSRWTPRDHALWRGKNSSIGFFFLKKEFLWSLCTSKNLVRNIHQCCKNPCNSLSLSSSTMDKIILSSTSTPLSTSSLPPLRTVTSTASLSSPKKLFLLRSTQSQRKLSSSSRRSTSFCKVHKSTTITCGAITEINESEFQNVVLNSDRPVLVEFVATWCGPCRLISPAMESVAQVSFFLTILFNHDYTLAFDYKRVFFFTVPIHVFLRWEQKELILMIFLVWCG